MPPTPCLPADASCLAGLAIPATASATDDPGPPRGVPTAPLGAWLTEGLTGPTGTLGDATTLSAVPLLTG